MRSNYSARRPFGRQAMSLLLAATIAGSVWTPPAAHAGKEGVFINPTTYFTLEKIGVTGVSDATNLQFSLRLHNGAKSAVDFGQYGALVRDSSGRTYTAKLAGKQNALVQPGKEQDYAFLAKLPSGVAAGDLQVTVFAWDYSQKSYIRELGSLSVSAAAADSGTAGSGTTIYLNAVDDKLSADAAASYSVARTSQVYDEEQGWILYTDLLVTNAGKSALTLPAGLSYQLEDADGELLPLESVGAALGAIPAGQTRKLTLKSGVPLNDGEARAWTVQIGAKLADGTELELTSLGADSAASVAALGGSQPYIRTDGSSTLRFQLASATAAEQPDQTVVEAVVTLKQTVAKYATLPTLQAQFQSKSGAGSFTASDVETRTTSYVSANGTATYRFQAALPVDVDASDLQLVLFESAGAGAAAAAVPVFAGDLKGARVTDSLSSDAVAYTLGDKLELKNSGVLDEDMDVSLMDLQLYQNEATGYATAVAKIKLTNRDSSALAVPGLSFDLASKDGRVFSGVRQQTVAATIAPNTSYMLTYSFQVPDLEAGSDVELRVFGQKSTDTTRIAMGNFATAVQEDNPGDAKWALYPFSLNVKQYYRTMNMGSGTFNYMLQLDLDLQRLESIVYDTTVSSIQFEYTDVFGLQLSTTTTNLTGATRLVSGRNTVTIPSIKTSQYSSGDQINVYEVIATPNGQVKRLIGSFDS